VTIKRIFFKKKKEKRKPEKYKIKKTLVLYLRSAVTRRICVISPLVLCDLLSLDRIIVVNHIILVISA